MMEEGVIQRFDGFIKYSIKNVTYKFYQSDC